MVQRWPAVPTAPNSTARSARSRSASSITMMALLPPSSSRRAAEALADDRRRCAGPCGRSRWRRSAGSGGRPASVSPTSEPRPMTRLKIAAQAVALHHRGWRCSARRSRSAASCDDGFQIIVSPQTAAIAAFQAQTATGKLKAVMMPIGPSGCHCSYMRCSGALGVHGQAVELARETDREVADVDHLLDLAQALGQDLAHLQRDQPAERAPCACAAPRRAGGRPRRAWARASCARS